MINYNIVSYKLLPIGSVLEEMFSYRGRKINTKDLEFILGTIQNHCTLLASQIIFNHTLKSKKIVTILKSKNFIYDVYYLLSENVM